MLGPSIGHPLVRSGAVKSGLGGNYEPGRIGMKGLGDDFSAEVRPVRVGRIDKVDSEFDSAAQDANGFLAVLGFAPYALAGDAHGAEPEAMDAQVAANPKCAALGGGQVFPAMRCRGVFRSHVMTSIRRVRFACEPAGYSLQRFFTGSLIAKAPHELGTLRGSS